jgi:hypothetical protein
VENRDGNEKVLKMIMMDLELEAECLMDQIHFLSSKGFIKTFGNSLEVSETECIRHFTLMIVEVDKSRYVVDGKDQSFSTQCII